MRVCMCMCARQSGREWGRKSTSEREREWAKERWEDRTGERRVRVFCFCLSAIVCVSVSIRVKRASITSMNCMICEQTLSKIWHVNLISPCIFLIKHQAWRNKKTVTHKPQIPTLPYTHLFIIICFQESSEAEYCSTKEICLRESIQCRKHCSYSVQIVCVCVCVCVWMCVCECVYVFTWRSGVRTWQPKIKTDLSTSPRGVPDGKWFLSSPSAFL